MRTHTIIDRHREITAIMSVISNEVTVVFGNHAMTLWLEHDEAMSLRDILTTALENPGEKVEIRK